MSSETEAGTVCTNLLAGIKKTSLKVHKAGPRAMIIPLGETDGVSPCRRFQIRRNDH